MPEISLDGWDIARFGDVEWAPWGSGDLARAKVLASGDGYHLALVEAQPGYTGDPHVHAHAEFLYVISGSLRNQGRDMGPGDGYVAAAGSSHTDFSAPDGATYLSIFKI
jgi:mannose-6-phosphate isomerase-like protein (cupin superfamily)